MVSLEKLQHGHRLLISSESLRLEEAYGKVQKIFKMEIIGMSCKILRTEVAHS